MWPTSCQNTGLTECQNNRVSHTWRWVSWDIYIWNIAYRDYKFMLTMTSNIYLFTSQLKAEMGEADDPLGVTHTITRIKYWYVESNTHMTNHTHSISWLWQVYIYIFIFIYPWNICSCLVAIFLLCIRRVNYSCTLKQSAWSLLYNVITHAFVTQSRGPDTHVSVVTSSCKPTPFNTLRPRQYRRHFADDIFKCISFYEH